MSWTLRRGGVGFAAVLSAATLFLLGRASVETPPHSLLDRWQQRRGPSLEAPDLTQEANQGAQSAFTGIYTNNIWDGGAGSGSGRGSEPEHTVGAQLAMVSVIAKYRMTSIIDIPCGAMKWMSGLLPDLEDIQPKLRYLGADIVPHVIGNNTLRFRNKFPIWDFKVMDFSTHQIPRGYQLILCRDALQHLDMDLITKGLETFARSSARFLLVGSYKHGFEGLTNNIRIETGGYFPIFLDLPPFSLPAPSRIYDEHYDGKQLFLYKISDLSKVDFKAMKERVLKF